MARRNPEGFYVYAYFEPGCELPFYVGKGCGDRHRRHFVPSKLTRRTAMACKLRSLLSQGIRPIIKILAQRLPEPAAIALEKHVIWLFGRRDIRTGCLMNHTDGGEGQSGRLVSRVTRDKLRDAHLGRQLTTEHRRKIGLGGLKPIVAIAVVDSTQRLEYAGRCEATKHGYPTISIHRALKSGRPYRGYIWKYKEAGNEIPTPRIGLPRDPSADPVA